MATNSQGVVQPTSTINKTIVNKPYFVGFNTVDQPNPPYSLTDIELVKRDILNQFQPPMGSRVMLPDFGTNIFSYLFEPFDEITKDAIISDAANVVNSDPRVQLQSLDAYQQDQTLNIIIYLLFVPQNVTDSLYVTFSLQNQNSF